MFRPLIAAALLTGLAACATTKAPDRIADARTPTEHFQAKVTAADQEIRLAVHAQGLSPTQAEALAAFAADWREAEGGTITLSAPVGGAQPRGAFRTVEGARGVLIGQGVAEDHIAVVNYDAKGDPAAPLRIAYLRYQVQVPACGKTWTNIAHSSDNDVQPNFGCAVTANMAVQIANPADLAHPRASTPIDMQRREVMLDKYRKGQVTSSDKDEQAKGVISNVAR
jgi:pilus assembly protein CpaD